MSGPAATTVKNLDAAQKIVGSSYAFVLDGCGEEIQVEYKKLASENQAFESFFITGKGGSKCSICRVEKDETHFCVEASTSTMTTFVEKHNYNILTEVRRSGLRRIGPAAVSNALNATCSLIAALGEHLP